MNKQIKTKKSFAVIMCGLAMLPSTAQNTTSPYSVLGIGSIDNKSVGKYFLAGSSSLSRRDAGAYNFSNPASLTGLTYKTVMLDMATRGKLTTFHVPGEDSSTTQTKDLVIKRVSLVFKTGKKSGLAFGLRPYSSVNYKYRDNLTILDGNTEYIKHIEGNGGINQFYFSAGWSLSKKFSAGITAGFLFGSLQRTTSYVSSSIELDVTKEERDLYNGGSFTGGIQYHSSGKKWKHQLGIIGTINTTLKGQLTTTYYDAGILLSKNLDNERKFELPVSAGIGYSAIRNDKLIISAEARYDYWKKQGVSYINSYTGSAVRISGGMEFLFKDPVSPKPHDRPYIGWGIAAENSYLRIRNEKLWDYSISVGGGFSPTANLSLYTGLELGQTGNLALGQIKETYTQFILGITVKDFWFGTKEFARYD